jgi:16S rRNA processing protein RimM
MSVVPVSGPDDRMLIVGTIRKPHGIRGELVVELETDRPDAVFVPGRSLRLGDAQGRPSDGVLTVERARPFKGGLLVRTAEHQRLDEAVQALRGRTLLLASSEVSPLDEDEVFLHDLVGLTAVAEGQKVGVVVDVTSLPSGLLLVVRRKGKSDLYIPFVRQIVSHVDLERQVVELDPPPGLLEL